MCVYREFISRINLQSYKSIKLLSDRGYIIIFAGICATNISAICANAFFLYMSDIFAFTLLLAVVSALANGVLAGISAVMLCFVCRRKMEIFHIFLLAAIFIVFPLGANCICFMSNGYVQELMIYSFWFVYLLPILVFGIYEKQFGTKNITKIFRGMILGCIFIVIINNIVLANQLYTKKKLAYDSTQTIVTRMLCRMEMTDGYIEGTTPVYIVGDLGKNPAFKNSYREFDQANDIRGAKFVSAITYDNTRGRFFKYIMGTKVKLLHKDTSGELRARASEMPIYPAQGFCQMYQGVLIVRISKK